MNRFYWELINTVRKSILLCLPVLFSTSSINYKVLSATLVMIAILKMQNKLEPYIKDDNNDLEFSEIITG